MRLALPVLVGAQSVVGALDTTRLGPWEVWLAGRVRAGRTLPLGWAVLPYPWPKGRFRVTTLALIQQLQQAFPVGVHGTLVADRGLPSAALVAQLRQGRTGFSARLRLSDGVRVGRVYAMVADHVEAGRLRVGQRTAAMMGRGQPHQPLVLGWVVVSAAVAALPKHTQTHSKGGSGFLRSVAPGSHLTLLVKQVRQRRRFEPDLRVATDPFGCEGQHIAVEVPHERADGHFQLVGVATLGHEDHEHGTQEARTALVHVVLLLRVPCLGRQQIGFL